MNLQTLRGDRSFWSALFRLALPIALQNLLTTSFSLIDNLMIAGLGEDNVALGAVGMANQLTWLMALAFFGMTSGGAVFISQYWGAKDHRGIQRTYGFILTVMTAVALLFTSVGLFAPQWVIGLFTDSAAHIEQGSTYLRVAGLSYLAIALQQVFSTVLRSTENVKLPMYSSAVAAVFNVGLNALFMYGMGMGVLGAALGTAISAWVPPVLLLIISLKRRNILIAPIRAMFDWSREFILKYVRISSPVLLNELFWAVGTLGYRWIYSNVDEEFFAALSLSNSIADVAFVFFVGLCHACTVLVGRSVGAGDYRRAIDDSRRFAFWVTALSGIMGLALVACRTWIVDITQISGAAREMARGILLIIGVELMLRNFPYITIVGIFRAGGDTSTGFIIDTVCVWLIALPLTFWCAFGLKLDLVIVYAVMLFSEDLFKNFLCFRRFISNKWIRPVTAPSGSAEASATTVL